jgi:hypothetical protein
MDYSTTEPRLTAKGIIFSVEIDSSERKCFISRNALDKLSELKNIDTTDADAMEVFHAFQVTIRDVARRLVAANVSGTPIVLTPTTFH